VIVFHRLQVREAQRDGLCQHAGKTTPCADQNDKELLEMKKTIIRVERHVLQELGFAVAALLEHPHKYVLQFVKSLIRTPEWLLSEFAQKAWNYLNDSTRTDLCCRYEPHQIAAASILLAARVMQIKLPSYPPWWQVFDAQIADIQYISRVIMQLYCRKAPRYIHVASKKLVPVPSDPHTPLLDTPAPLQSPSDEEKQGLVNVCIVSGNSSQQEFNMDPKRLSEIVGEHSPRTKCVAVGCDPFPRSEQTQMTNQIVETINSQDHPKLVKPWSPRRHRSRSRSCVRGSENGAYDQHEISHRIAE